MNNDHLIAFVSVLALESLIAKHFSLLIIIKASLEFTGRRCFTENYPWNINSQLLREDDDCVQKFLSVATSDKDLGF